MKVDVKSNLQDTIKSLETALENYNDKLSFQIFRALTLVEAEVLANLRGKSGLKVRSGALLNSVSRSKRVFEHSGYVYGELGPEGIPYAAIHEFGGRTRPHIIRPRLANALRFPNMSFVGGGGSPWIFARVVNHPGSNIPARPYMRPALAAKKDQILKDFGLFLKASFEDRK